MKAIVIICLCLLALPMRAQDDVNYMYMDSLFQQLPEVLVEGEHPVVKAEKGRLVYDMPRLVEKLPVSNAYEAIKELPGIVEQNGSLTLGNRSVTIVLNGKVNNLDAEDLKSMLESTPVSRLERAEIMYAAPARYHIRGAMVNVVLKSGVGQRPSLSGEVAATYEQSRRESLTGRGSLLYTSGRLSADLMYSYGFSHSAWDMEKDSWHTLDGEVSELSLLSNHSGYGGRHNVRLGVDYDFGKKNMLSVLYNGQFRYGEDRSTMQGTANSFSDLDGERHLHNIKVDYHSSFGFSAGADFLFSKSPSSTYLQKTIQDERTEFDYDSDQRINRWLFYLAQFHKLAEGTEINYGVKYSTTHDNSYQYYWDRETGELMADNSSKLLRKEYTLNMYTGASHSFGKKLSGEVSLAAELYHAKERHSWMIYPTVNLTYTPTDGHTLQFSFTSNREYPSYWQMQPIVEYVDSYTESHGNPDLKPSSDYSFELNYLYRNKYMIGVGYEYTPDYFVQLPYQLPDRLAEMNQFVNYDFQKKWTVQAMVPYRVGKWWNGRVFGLGLFSHDKDSDFHDISFDRYKVTVILNTMNTFTISQKPDITGTLSGFYQSRAIQGIYDLHPVCNISASLQWTSPDKKMQVSLKGNDIFQTSNMTMRVDWDAQNCRTKMNWDRRSVTLLVLYKLGGYKEKRRAEVDTKRLGK